MKYNWSIIGHEKQLLQIEYDIASGNLSHAYLLAGPNSIGKSTVAKKMAGILQCENDFCHKCPSCLQISKGSHPDTLDFAADKDSIGIDDVRALIERLNMTGNSKYKVIIIRKLERMTVPAANSFLKVLEEPTDGTVFIMTTDNIRILLPTVLSRLRAVKFSSVSPGFLETKLRELFPEEDPETIKKASLFSLGMTGRAMRLMENPDVLAQNIKVYHNVKALLEQKNIPARFAYLEEILEEDGVHTFLDMVTHVLRSKMLEGGVDTEKHLKSLSKIDDTGILLKKNVNPRLALESLMLSL